MLSIEGLQVRYDDGAPAVDDVTLAVPDGEVLALLGPSGCGKSSLLRAVAGLEPAAAGRICWDGADLAGVPTHKRGFALMFQDGQLFSHLTVARNVGYALRSASVPDLLALVGLSGYGDRLPATLSGGERQRVALARSLAARPRLLLLDEPLSALDTGLRERLAGDLRAILHDTGTTTLLVTHDQEEAFAVADRLAVMRDGRLVQHGPVADVWAQPADADTALFLGYARVLDGARAVALLGAAGLPPAPAVALRRSALTVAPDGPVHAEVLAVRASPEQSRLLISAHEFGELDAVASPGEHLAPGDAVWLRIDPARLAPIGRAGSSPARTGPPRER